jgi:hypothetical protein
MVLDRYTAFDVVVNPSAKAHTHALHDVLRYGEALIAEAMKRETLCLKLFAMFRKLELEVVLLDVSDFVKVEK